MKVLVIYQARECRLEDRPMPVITRPDQVIVQVKAVGICGSDMATYLGAPTRKLPLVPCHEFSGQVYQVGSAVTEFAPGDRVVIEPMLVCGECYACRAGRPNVCRELKTVGSHCDGAVQEYFLTTQDKLYRIPEEMNYRQATLIEPFTIGAQVNDRMKVKAGDHVLIHGAGPIGLVVMMVAKRLGASVAMSEVSAGRRSFAQRLGADLVIDPRTEDLTQRIMAFTGGHGPDVIVDSAGIPGMVTQAVELANEGGRIGNICFGQVEVPIDGGKLVEKGLTISGSRLQTNQFRRVIEEYTDTILDADEMITDVFPLERADEAFALFGSRKETTGKIVIEFN